MGADKKTAGADVIDEDIRDILIAISVTAKRIATRIENAGRNGSQENKLKT